MKFLADQDVYASTVELLRANHHDVATARELGLSQASDLKLLQTANEQLRVLITRDRDFGSLIFGSSIRGGAIYLRLTPSVLSSVHAELLRVLDEIPAEKLHHCLVVVEPGRHRLREFPRQA
jgi:predicted nuclease of predicted toxin-antitoxin system